MKQPYPSYKPSGVEWLGDLPDYWEIKRLKHSVTRSDTKVESEHVEAQPYVGLEHVASWTGGLLSLDGEQMPESLCNSFRTGDVLFSKLRPYLAKAFCAEFDGLCSTEFLALSVLDHKQRYLLYLLLSDGFVSLVDSSTYGAKMPRANWDFIGDMPLPVPPLYEQQAVIELLDHETAKIDALISKKQQLIERLAEYRTALITRTVTKGLPPDAAKAAGLDPAPPLKASGVEWIGDVPEHWAVYPFRWILREPLKYGANEAADMNDPDLPRYIRITDIDNNGYLRDETFRSLPVDVAAPYLLDAGDLLFARSGSVGRTFLYDESWGSCAYAGYLIRARIEAALAIPQFIAYFSASHSYASWLRTEAIQSTIENVNAERYSRMPVPLPPVGEQRAIVSFIGCQTSRIDLLSARVEAAIERLREYRTALITAAVTGKIDVRNREQVNSGTRV